MLALAKLYENDLKNELYKTWFLDKYKFYNADIYYRELELEKDTWNKHQFVSLDKNDNVIGYIAYCVNRQLHSCCGLEIINFTDNSVVFGLDIGQVLIDIFEKFHFNKLNFAVVIGNPIEESYDKMIKKYGGRIVGIKRDNARLIDGNFYDEKLYEITSDEYFNSKGYYKKGGLI